WPCSAWPRPIDHCINSALHEKLARKKAQNKGEPQVAARPWSHSGEGGIRTLGRLASTPVFETGPIGRAGTSPAVLRLLLEGRKQARRCIAWRAGQEPARLTGLVPAGSEIRTRKGGGHDSHALGAMGGNRSRGLLVGGRRRRR